MLSFSYLMPVRRNSPRVIVHVLTPIQSGAQGSYLHTTPNQRLSLTPRSSNPVSSEAWSTILFSFCSYNLRYVLSESVKVFYARDVEAESMMPLPYIIDCRRFFASTRALVFPTTP